MIKTFRKQNGKSKSNVANVNFPFKWTSGDSSVSVYCARSTTQQRAII